MSNNKVVFQLPKEIDLLFENIKLDILIYLGVLYYLKINSRKKKFVFDQLLFFYSIVYSQSHKTNFPMIYKYLRDEKMINEIMMYLYNKKYVKIHGDIFTPISKLKVSITQEGIKVVESFESDSVKQYLRYISITTNKYSYEKMSSNFKRLLLEGSLENDN